MRSLSVRARRATYLRAHAQPERSGRAHSVPRGLDAGEQLRNVLMQRTRGHARNWRFAVQAPVLMRYFILGRGALVRAGIFRTKYDFAQRVFA